MQQLKAMKDKMRAEAIAAKTGDKKYVTKAELEASRLGKLREEEERERQEKARRGAWQCNAACPFALHASA